MGVSSLNRRVFNPTYRHVNWRKGHCEVGEEWIYGCGVVSGAGVCRENVVVGNLSGYRMTCFRKLSDEI